MVVRQAQQHAQYSAGTAAATRWEQLVAPAPAAEARLLPMAGRRRQCAQQQRVLLRRTLLPRALHLSTRTTGATSRQEPAWEPQRDASADALISWVRGAGGFVHPSLAVVADAPCGCRGIVAQQDITEAAGGNGSAGGSGAAEAGEPHALLVVPEQLYMTTDDALDRKSVV